MLDVLLIEDSPVQVKVLMRKFNETGRFNVIHAATYAETKAIIEQDNRDFFICLADLVLPDARDGEVVNLVTEAGLPTLVFSSIYSDDIRDRCDSKGVIDYVVKQGAHNVDYIVELIERIEKNRHVKVLVVDDSAISRTMIRAMLELYRFQVLEADNGLAAIKVVSEYPDIALMIIDYMMPEMDGIALLQWLRTQHGKDRNELAVIGLSAYGSHALSAKFIKNGGNDFLSKPFLKEEFICRVIQNVEHLEHLNTIREMAQKDHLTGMFNRRHFFHLAEPLFNNARRENIHLSVGLMDLDHFKTINDTYGHHAGDLVLREVATVLKKNFRDTDVVARMGGEEFCVLATNVKPEALFETFDRLRQEIAAIRIPFSGADLTVTTSIGVTNTLRDSLKEMITDADRLLYAAKESGRDRVKIE
ncbi:MAG: diguanylate cyclase [Magnetococcales bacterium]|nr:diguanylate cyclase [Magnetococcales bacterium]